MGFAAVQLLMSAIAFAADDKFFGVVFLLGGSFVLAVEIWDRR